MIKSSTASSQLAVARWLHRDPDARVKIPQSSEVTYAQIFMDLFLGPRNRLWGSTQWHDGLVGTDQKVRFYGWLSEFIRSHSIEDWNLLDFGGGTGELIQRVSFEAPLAFSRQILIEPNESLCAVARALLPQAEVYGCSAVELQLLQELDGPSCGVWNHVLYPGYLGSAEIVNSVTSSLEFLNAGDILIAITQTPNTTFQDIIVSYFGDEKRCRTNALLVDAFTSDCASITEVVIPAEFVATSAEEAAEVIVWMLGLADLTEFTADQLNYKLPTWREIMTLAESHKQDKLYRFDCTQSVTIMRL